MFCLKTKTLSHVFRVGKESRGDVETGGAGGYRGGNRGIRSVWSNDFKWVRPV